MATSSLYGSVSESTGLYGIGAASGGTYFEWFIFYDSATAPATPTGGSWSFTTNNGIAPTGWLSAPPAAPVNQVWVSIAIVDSRSTSSLVWSTPGLMTGSGLPILTGSGVPSSGTGLNGQLYINTATTPQSMYNKQSGAWVQLTGASLYATSGVNSNITGLTGLNAGGIATPTFIQMSTAGDGAKTAGKLQWDPTYGGPTIGMSGGNVNQNIGQDGFVYVYNNTGSTINKGQVVYISGSQGQKLTVALAQANDDATSISVLGFAAEAITNNNSGFVATFGLVENINTNGFADGASIWLSPTTPGGFTTTKPVAPNHLVLLGYVVKGNSVGGGSVYVFTQNGYELDELHDVRITSLANRNLLQYDSSVPAWVNIPGPNGSIVGTTDTQTLTNKTISGANNTLSNIPNSALVNDRVTVNGIPLILGANQTIAASWLLPSYAGNAGKVLAVNPSASDVQWITAGGVGTVTSVDLSTGSTGLTATGGPITAAGTITLGGTLNVANGGTGVTTSTGTGSVVLSNSPTLVTPNLGTPTAGNFSTGTFTWPTFNQNTTGNAATATTATNVSGGSASVTTLTTSSVVTLNGGTANQVQYLDGSKVLTGSANMTFNGTRLTVADFADSSLTSGRVTYAGAGGNLTDSANLVFDGNNLGIGTSSPAASCRLEVAGTNSTTLVRNSTTTAANGFNAFSTGGNFYFGIDSSAGNFYGAGAYGRAIYSDGAYPIVFYTNAAERMRLNASGNLGIGTSSPSTRLDVVGSATVSGSVFSTAFINTSNGTSYFTDASTGNGLYVGGSTASPANTVRLFTNAAERMRLDSAGNLGLNITPSAWSAGSGRVLQIRAAQYFGDDTQSIVAHNTYFNSSWLYQYTGVAATRYDQTAGTHRWFTAPSGTAGTAISFTQAMTLSASGNLSIGTTATDIAKIYTVTTAAGLDNYRMADENSSVASGIRAVGDAIAFRTVNAERARIDSIGNLGVGTTSPATRVHADNGANATFLRTTSTQSTAGFDFGVGGSGDPTAYVFNRNNTPIVFATNATERARINASGIWGINTTPSAWSASIGLMDFRNNGALSSDGSNFYVSNNIYYDGGNDRRKTANPVSVLSVGGASGIPFRVLYAGTGTADSVVSLSEAMRIDSSGRLGVGTTSPSARIDAAGGASQGLNASADVFPAGFAATNGSFLLREFGGSAANNTLEINIRPNSGRSGYLTFTESAIADRWSIGIQNGNDALRFISGTPTSGTERARITSGGNLLVGTTNAAYATGERFSVAPASGTNGIGIAIGNTNNVGLGIYNGYTATGTATAVQFQDHNSVVRGSITVTTSATAYNTSSDYRLKENIQPMTGALAKVSALKPCTYTWKADGSDGEGFIAHELAEVVPQAVTGEKDAVDENGNPQYQGIDTSFLVATLTAAIQEQQVIINQLKARLDAANL